MKKYLVIIVFVLLLMNSCVGDLSTEISTMDSSLTEATTELMTDSTTTQSTVTENSSVILKYIEVDPLTLLNTYEVGTFGFEGIDLILYFNQDLESHIPLEASMVIESLDSINEPGIYDLHVSYLNQTTSFTIEIVEAYDVVGISVDEESFNPYGLVSTYDTSKIIINVEYENDTTKQIPLKIDMINENDFIKFFMEGYHEIDVSYRGFHTSFNIALMSENPENNPLFHPTGEAAVFYEVFDLLLDIHFKAPTVDTLYAGATQGMIDVLEDQFTRLFDEEAYSNFYGALYDNYIGTGVIPNVIEDMVVVGQIIEGSSAELAGIQVDDIIISINDVDVTADNINEIYQTIISEEDVEVSFKLERMGVSNLLEITLVTAETSLEPLTYEIIETENKKIGMITVSIFSSHADEKFEVALNYLESEGINGLIIDLRNNGGGFLSTVTNMLQLFLLNNGRPIFQMDYRNGLDAYWPTLDEKKPYDIVTLVNGSTASASEVFASSMQEHGGYTIIGEQTYGKGIAQTTRSLDSNDDMFLHISHAKWLTSNGNWIHKYGGTGGVMPNIIIEPNVLEMAYKIYLHNNQQLTYESFNQENINLQIILNGMGYSLRTDGFYDLDTKAAIEDIQNTNGLEMTGNVDVLTALIINEWLENYQASTDTQYDEAIDYIIENTVIK